MGTKDIVGKNLFHYNDIFADTANVLLFDGEQLVSPDDLVDATPFSQYKADDGELHEQVRDVSKYWKKNDIIISLMAIENQTVADKFMPARVIGYDGASYRSQLLVDGIQWLYPVMTMVLYYGKTHWNYSRNLIDLMKIPDIAKGKVEDYKIRNLFEISFLTQKQVNMFKSDFRIVADYFVQTRTNKEYKPSPYEIKHVDSVLKLMNVMTGMEWTDEYIEVLKQKGEPVTMESAYKGIYEKGIAQGESRGISIGEARGRNEGRISVYYEDMKMSPEAISKKMNEPLDVVNNVIQKLKK